MKRYITIAAILTLGLMAFKADDYFEISKNLDIFASVYKEVNTTYVDEVKPGELIRAAVDGMLKSLDPYTNFYSEAQAEDYQYQITGTYAGIGSSIRRIGDYIVIESPYDGYPAQKAGLLPGDEIISIDGIPMKGKKTSEISEFLKGNAGTKVEIVVNRMGAGELTKTITREQIQVKNVPYYGIVDGNVGYIKLTGFMAKASNEVREATMKLKQQGARSIVIDLRNNGGGLMMEAVRIVNVFVDRNTTIVTTKGKYKEDYAEYHTEFAPVDTEIPLAILINGNSASASEIVAGSIQDLDRGVIIGRNSFGKGLVQTTKRLTYNTQMKITTAKYYIPSGRLIQRLDYGNKVNGKATEVADSAKNVFFTRNGRPVTDGEGIHPDIKVDAEPFSKISQSLLSNNLTFLYANKFRSEHDSIAPPRTFEVSESVYDDFTNYLQDKEYQYTTKTEETLQALIKQAKEDKYYSMMQDEFEVMEDELNVIKKDDLLHNKAEIKELLEYEIVKRYYFDQGKVEVGFDDDDDLKEAISKLNNITELNKILSNK